MPGLLLLFAQSTADQAELELFEKLLESSPFRILIALLGLAILVMILVCMMVIRTVTKNAEAITNSANDNLRAQDKQTDRLTDLLERQTAAFERLGDSQMRQHEQLGDFREDMSEAYTYLKTVTDRAVDVVETAARANAVHSESTLAVMRETSQMSETLQRFIVEQFALYGERVAEQRGAQLVKFQFPQRDDCRWKMMIVRPASPDHPARVYVQPYWNDNNLVGHVRASGVVARVIEYTSITGWHCLAVDFSGDDDPLQGWVDQNTVMLQPLTNEPQPVSAAEKTGE